MCRGLLENKCFPYLVKIYIYISSILNIPNITPRITRNLNTSKITHPHYSLNSIETNFLNNKIELIVNLEKSRP